MRNWLFLGRGSGAALLTATALLLTLLVPSSALAWEDSYLALARQLLDQGLKRSSFKVYADVARRSDQPSLKADCLEMMAALSLHLGQPGNSRALLDRAAIWRAKAMLHEKQYAEKMDIGGGGPVIRVLLAKKSVLELDLPTPCRDAAGRVRLPKGSVIVSASSDGLYLRNAPGGQRVSCRPDGGAFGFDGKKYAGNIHFVLESERVLLVNSVPLETYLLGVVPAEMPASWDKDALQAQAVAARTYALHRLRTPRSPEYDVHDDERDQVYVGLSRRTEQTDQAVMATRGQSLTHDGAPILAMYHAHSGGSLECASAKGHPYLQGGRDNHSLTRWGGDWVHEVPAGTLREAFGQPVQGAEVLERTTGGRLVSLRLWSDQGSWVVNLRRLKRLLAPQRLPSALCSVELKNGRLVLSGKGWGHGLGMSQWGARTLAENGSSTREILARYYPGAKLSASYP